MGWRDTIKPAGQSSWRDTIVSETKDPDDIPALASGAAGFEQAVPFSHQLGAVGKTAMDVLSGATSLGDAPDEYRSERGSLKKDLGEVAGANPKSAFVGGLAAAPFMPIQAGAKGGALYGGAKALGDSDADLTKGEILPALNDAAIGATAGAVVGDAAEQAGKYISKGSQGVSDWLKRVAEKKALNATGATGLQASKFADDAGRQLLDRKIIGFGNSQSQIAQKAADALQKSGEGINAVIGKLDDMGVKVNRNKVVQYLKSKLAGLSGDESQNALADKIRGKIADVQEQIANQSENVSIPLGESGDGASDVRLKYGKPETQSITVQPPSLTRPNYENIPETVLKAPRPTPERLAQMREAGEASQAVNLSRANESGYDPYNNKIDVPVSEVSKSGVIERPEIGIGKAERIKQGFDKGAKWDSNADSTVRDANKMAANAYRTASEDAATEANPELAAIFKADKDTYHLLKPIVKAAERRSLTTAQSPHGGLLDTTAALTGATVGGHGGAAVAPTLRRALSTRSASAMAVGSDALASLVASAPERFGKYGPALAAAAAKGGNTLRMTDKILQQTDPEYRQKLAEIGGAKLGAGK